MNKFASDILFDDFKRYTKDEKREDDTSLSAATIRNALSMELIRSRYGPVVVVVVVVLFPSSCRCVESVFLKLLPADRTDDYFHCVTLSFSFFFLRNITFLFSYFFYLFCARFTVRNFRFAIERRNLYIRRSKYSVILINWLLMFKVKRISHSDKLHPFEVSIKECRSEKSHKEKICESARRKYAKNANFYVILSIDFKRV